MDESARAAQRQHAVEGTRASLAAYQRGQVRAGLAEELALECWEGLRRAGWVRRADVLSLMQSPPAGQHGETCWRWQVLEPSGGNPIVLLGVTDGDVHTIGWKDVHRRSGRRINPGTAWEGLKPYGRGKPETLARKHLAWTEDHGTVVTDGLWQVMTETQPAPYVTAGLDDPLAAASEADDETARLKMMVAQARAYHADGDAGLAKSICGLILHMLSDVQPELASSVASELLPMVETIVKGNTYPVRELLKDLGFRWNAANKQWTRRVTLGDVDALEDEVESIGGGVTLQWEEPR